MLRTPRIKGSAPSKKCGRVGSVRCITIATQPAHVQQRRLKVLQRLRDKKWMETAGKRRRQQLAHLGGISDRSNKHTVDGRGTNRMRRLAEMDSTVDFENDLRRVGVRVVLSGVREPLPRKLRIMIERATDTRITPIYSHLSDSVWHRIFAEFRSFSTAPADGSADPLLSNAERDHSVHSVMKVERIKECINHGVVFSQLSAQPMEQRQQSSAAAKKQKGTRVMRPRFERVASSFRKVFSGRVLIEAKKDGNGTTDMRDAVELYLFLSSALVKHQCSIPMSNVPPAVFDLVRDYFYNRVLVYRRSPFVQQAQNAIPVITPTIGRAGYGRSNPAEPTRTKLTTIHSDAIHALSNILSMLPETPPKLLELCNRVSLTEPVRHREVINYRSFVSAQQQQESDQSDRGQHRSEMEEEWTKSKLSKLKKQELIELCNECEITVEGKKLTKSVLIDAVLIEQQNRRKIADSVAVPANSHHSSALGMSDLRAGNFWKYPGVLCVCLICAIWRSESRED